MPSSETQLTPRITVIGVGGAGGNAVNNMINSNLEGVDFLVCNTDSQALEQSVAENKLQLGATLTQGLGAGARPEVGQAAAEEVMDEILDRVLGSNMVFVTAGMGGGTGTGAAPVIAQAARENGMLTVGVVTKPFHFEGAQRMRTAERGIEELAKYVDTLIIIPNQNLFRIANEKTTFAEAFNMADEVLNSGVRGVTDLMVMPGLINLDFADIRTVMSEMGKAMMGTGEANGDNRAIEAAESAISNPLLDDITMEGARGVLINITGGPDITLFEVDEAANRIRQEVDENANILFGSTFEESMEGKVRVSVVATGIDSNIAIKPVLEPKPLVEDIIPARPSLTREPVEEAEVMIETTAETVTELEPTPIEQAVVAAKLYDSQAAKSEKLPTEPIGAIAALDSVSAPASNEEETEEPSALDVRLEATQPIDAGLAISSREPFIPPHPLDIGETPEPESYPDPYNEAAFSNARSDLDLKRKKKRPSLFKRLTGAVKRKEQVDEMAALELVPPALEGHIPISPPSLPLSEPAAAVTEEVQEPGTIQTATANPGTLVTPELAPASEPLSFLHREEVMPIEPSQPVSAPQSTPPPAKPLPKPASSSDEFPLSQAEEEMLEIPAFLRRQAN
jgi:cell division protein FtsZ